MPEHSLFLLHWAFQCTRLPLTEVISSLIQLAILLQNLALIGNLMGISSFYSLSLPILSRWPPLTWMRFSLSVPGEITMSLMACPLCEGSSDIEFFAYYPSVTVRRLLWSNKTLETGRKTRGHINSEWFLYGDWYSLFDDGVGHKITRGSVDPTNRSRPTGAVFRCIIFHQYWYAYWSRNKLANIPHTLLKRVNICTDHQLLYYVHPSHHFPLYIHPTPFHLSSQSIYFFFAILVVHL